MSRGLRGLSLWLFDEREGTRADAESILNDFLEVVQGPKRVALVQQKHRSKKDGDGWWTRCSL